MSSSDLHPRSPRYDAIVIGAGIEGLTAAALLGGRKARVLVLERRDVIGGMAAGVEIAPGCRVSPCLQSVGWLPRDVVDALQLEDHGLARLSGESRAAIAESDGGWLTLASDPQRVHDALRARSPAAAARWQAFNRRVAPLAGFLETLYLSPPPRPRSTSIAEALHLMRIGMRLRRLGPAALYDLLRTLPMPVADLLDDWLDEPALQGALAGAAVAGALLGPRSPGTAFLLLHRLVGTGLAGIFRRSRLRGGPPALVAALAQACARRGVEVRCGAEVAAIHVSQGRTRGVRLADGQAIDAATVVSSADPRRTLLDLADAGQLDPELVRALQHIRYRGAASRVTLLVDRLPVFADGASPPPDVIAIAPTMDHVERAFDAAKHGEVSSEPCLEVTIPSIDDLTLCPPGQHVVSIAVQYTPYRLAVGTWDAARRDALGDRVVAELDRFMPGLASAVRARHVLTPRDIEATYGVPEGSLAYGEMALDQILFMRPAPGLAHYRTPVRGLYLCGTGTHPGTGVAGGSARLAVQAILADGH